MHTRRKLPGGSCCEPALDLRVRAVLAQIRPDTDMALSVLALACLDGMDGAAPAEGRGDPDDLRANPRIGGMVCVAAGRLVARGLLVSRHYGSAIQVPAAAVPMLATEFSLLVLAHGGDMAALANDGLQRIANALISDHAGFFDQRCGCSDAALCDLAGQARHSARVALARKDVVGIQLLGIRLDHAMMAGTAGAITTVLADVQDMLHSVAQLAPDAPQPETWARALFTIGQDVSVLASDDATCADPALALAYDCCTTAIDLIACGSHLTEEDHTLMRDWHDQLCLF